MLVSAFRLFKILPFDLSNMKRNQNLYLPRFRKKAFLPCARQKLLIIQQYLLLRCADADNVVSRSSQKAYSNTVTRLSAPLYFHVLQAI